MLSLWVNWLQLNSQLNSSGVSFCLYRTCILYETCMWQLFIFLSPYKHVFILYTIAHSLLEEERMHRIIDALAKSGSNFVCLSDWHSAVVLTFHRSTGSISFKEHPSDTCENMSLIAGMMFVLYTVICYVMQLETLSTTSPTHTCIVCHEHVLIYSILRRALSLTL